MRNPQRVKDSWVNLDYGSLGCLLLSEAALLTFV